MDEKAYEKVCADREALHESICTRCGQCCGADGEDPCVNLEKLDNGTYSCRIYEKRHGLRQTRSGRSFMCVNIRDVIKSGARYDNCPYCTVV